MKRRLTGLLLGLAMSSSALAQSATPTPRATAAPALQSEDEHLQEAVEEALGEEENEAPPSAKDADRPAIFGAMIASRLREKAGTPVGRIRRDSLVPWGVSLVLLPIYLSIARRRGFRISEEAR